MKATMKNTIDRKTLVKAIKAQGIKEVIYNGAPTMSYTIGGNLNLDRDGNITGDIESNYNFLLYLEGEGLIDLEGYETVEGYQPPEDTEVPTEAILDERAAALVAEAQDEAQDDGGEAEAQTEDHGAAEAYAEFEARGEQPETDIHFSISGWNAEKLRNLVFTIFSKGNLISKATGGSFGANQTWCETHRKDNDLTWRDCDKAVRDGLITGLEFTEDSVYFTGLGKTITEMEPDELERNLLLFGFITKAMGDDARQRVNIKLDTSENEKYAFRSWISRLGWNDNGERSKKARAAFYAKLNGHVAFKTPADEAKWKEKQAAKRAAAKAAKEGDTANENA